MSSTGNSESGYRINNLVLLESTFKRINNVRFEGVKPELNLNINTDVGVQDNIISVAETVTVIQMHEGTEQFSFKVKMAGVFECIGESQLKDYEAFGKVNGAAIIFPYIREHISGIALKAGLGQVILPPVNFAGKRE